MFVGGVGGVIDPAAKEPRRDNASRFLILAVRLYVTFLAGHSKTLSLRSAKGRLPC